jgi:hypothetical protein
MKFKKYLYVKVKTFLNPFPLFLGVFRHQPWDSKL